MEDKAQRLVAALKEKKLTISVAESCTGGGFAAAITAVPGSSQVFPGSIVTYCDKMKQKHLQVPEEMLKTHGAVSEPVAEAMARGAAHLFEADLALSVTGLAGPDGDGSGKPVGTVFLGLYARGAAQVEHHVFSGDRKSVRRQAVERAMEMALQYLS